MQGKKNTVRKVPLRKCTGCQESKPKRELIRVVRSKEGDITLDPTGKKAGRGAYICPKESCLRAARKNRGLERAFSCAISPEVYDRLTEMLQEVPPDEG